MDTVLSNVVGPVISMLGNGFGYVFYHSRNLENLRKGDETLRGTKRRVAALVREAKRKRNVIHDDVDKWLDDVSKLNEDVESLLNQQVPSPDIKSRFWMSKKAYEMKLDRVDRLQIQGENFTEDKVSYTADPPPFSAIFSGDAVRFRSRDSIMEKILEALKKDDVKVLGLYGMGGMGKTTLIKEAVKRAEADKLFDEILMAVVSEDPSIRRIQDQFASNLGLSLGDDKESDLVRAGRLHEKLEKTGEVLVILDDLWKYLDLQDVGIPSPDKHKCCKIVITTREKDVCDKMDCKNNAFSVMPLSEEEAWHLFKKMAGDCVTYAEVEPVAIKVAKECGGLPLAIVVVARALKDKNLTTWKDALRQLRAPAHTYIDELQRHVYPSLRLSYDNLGAEDKRHFFLLFSLFPEDYAVPIEQQMRYGVGLGLLHPAGHDGTMQEARERADSFVDILESACLLLDADGETRFRVHDMDKERRVRVHDVVRDLCIKSIASKGQPHVFLVRSDSELTEWPEIDYAADYTADYTAISLFGNNIKLFPRGLDHSKLKFLLFRGEGQEVKIADSFFETMKELKVLDVSCVHIPLFPPSQGLLCKLRTLCLEDCILEEMEMIGHLKGLEVLSLSGSKFEDNTLPNGISLLTRLRLLDLSRCGRELLIPCGILSNLSRLEELYLENSFNDWEIKREEEFYIEILTSELKSSSHSLTTLMGMHVKDVTLFPKDLFFPNLTTFRIQIGDNLIHDKNFSISKAGLMVDFKGSSIAKDHGICSLMRRCDYLRLRQMGNMKRILYDFNKDLKVLVVEKSDNIEEIIISEEGEAVFPRLKCLRLLRLPKLASFCNVRQSKNPIQPHSLFTDKVLFPCLEELELEDQHEVENIWHPELPNESFLELKKLEVSNCKKVSKIIPTCMHPRLPKLQSLIVRMCASVEEVFEQQDLSTATGGELPKLTHAHSYNNLTDIRIFGCNSLTSLFRPSIAEGLVNLETLWVYACQEIQEIVGEDKEEETEKVIVLPKVESLWLCDLPKLTSFRKGDYQLKWQKCQNETSKNNGGETEPVATSSRNNLGCPRFQPFFNHKVSFPSLESMELDHLDGIKQIWGSQFPTEAFPRLRKLYVTGCDALEVVIGKQGEEEEIISGRNLVFPQLKTLALQHLRNIRCFSESNLYTLEFPSLDEMTLLHCRKMTTFSYTSATTPKLEQILEERIFDKQRRIREKYIRMTKDINTVAKDIFLKQGQVNRSTSKEEEVEEMVSTGEEEEGKEKVKTSMYITKIYGKI